MDSSSASGNLSPVPLHGKLPSISYSATNNKNFKMLHNSSPKNVKLESSMHIGGQMMPSGSAFVPRMHHQHLQQDDINAVVSPPLTPSTSPAAFLNGNLHFKRKYSVDVGPFGFNSTNSASIIPAVNACVQEDFYRRHSTCSDMSMDDYSHGADHFGFLATPDMSQNHGMHGSLPSPPRVDHRTNFSQFETHPTDQFYQDHAQQMHQLQDQIHHHAEHVQGSQNSQSKRKPTGNRHVCKYPYCGWSFKRYEHLKRHMLVHTGERPHVCNYPGCGKSFSRSDNFAAHYRTHTRRAMMQRRMSAIPSEYVPSDLSNNTMSFVNNDKFQQEYATNEQYSMQEHKSDKQQNIHSPSSPQSPSTPSALSQLIDYQQHHEQSQHLYETQPPSFTNLDRQFISMEDPMPTDSFMTTERHHGSIHNQSRRSSTSGKVCGKVHVCQVSHCQRKFKRLEHLKRHMRTHTMERPFTCSIDGCNKSFSRSDNLSQHIKTHQRREMRANTLPEDHTKPRFNNSTSPEHQVRESHDTSNVNMLNMSWHAGNASSVGC
ncbi:hypothetical protein BC943DRAFT_357455 [Umbelopsis sp. AD052]|nr:hypothetical protein BC943DRAFT_357455 [Umbelopsis sp. AD052]